MGRRALWLPSPLSAKTFVGQAHFSQAIIDSPGRQTFSAALKKLRNALPFAPGRA
jgi:hypothetical protein